jgi:hypothetical protein
MPWATRREEREIVEKLREVIEPRNVASSDDQHLFTYPCMALAGALDERKNYRAKLTYLEMQPQEATLALVWAAIKLVPDEEFQDDFDSETLMIILSRERQEQRYEPTE